MGYLSVSDPDNSFESGIFNRCRSIIIRCSKVSFFIIRVFIKNHRILVFVQDTDYFDAFKELFFMMHFYT